MIRRNTLALAVLATTTLLSPLAFGQAKDIKIAHIYSRTGPLEAYGKQTQTGLLMFELQNCRATTAGRVPAGKWLDP